MPPLKHHLDSARLRSGVFAFVFAPIALVFMGSSMTDVQSLTAAGQPLASVEGLIGLALASTLFALIAMNCDDSSAGMFVAFGWSLVIGAAQMAGYLQVPMLMKSPARPHDMLAAMSWSMYPVAMAAILAASAVTVKSVRVRAGETTRMPLARSHRSAFGASVALPAAAVVFAVYVYIAPNNSVRVAHEGLIGLVSSYEYHPAMALAGAGALAAMALSARWSITGTQLGAWAVLVMPSYLVVPVWASLTGKVVVPGRSPITQLLVAAPVLTALGLTVATTSLGTLWSRTKALRALSAAAEGDDQGPAGS